MKKRISLLFSAILAVLQFLTPSADAFSLGEIASYSKENETLVFYLSGPVSASEITCQIGTRNAQQVTVKPIAEEETPIETVILVDNSLSVLEKYRPTIRSILTEAAANRMNGEAFTVATFSDQLNILVESSKDYMTVKRALDGITHNNQETYLTDVLYDLLQELNAKNDSVLRRIIIVSDGVDEKAIGYTKDELYAMIESKPYPIYTIGCTIGDNSSELKNMYSLSRLTGAASFHLDDINDPMTVVAGLAELNDSVKVCVTPDPADLDGTRKGVSIRVATADGLVYEDSVEMQMPFGTVVEAVDVEPESETPEEPQQNISEPEAEEDPPSPAEESASEEELELEGATVPERSHFAGWIAVGIGAVLLAIILAVFFVVRKIAKTAEPSDKSESEASDTSETKQVEQRKTQYIPDGASKQKGPQTKAMFHQQVNHRIILQDKDQPMHRFEVDMAGAVLVGYNEHCQIRLDYDETISGEHCILEQENGRCFVKNLSKTNGTQVDHKTISERTEIFSGTELTLGSVTMKVELE